MADMQKRHRRLLEDAVVEAVVAFVQDSSVQRVLAKHNLALVAKQMARKMADRLQDKLRYTNESFEGSEAESWHNALLRRVDLAIKGAND